jgi:hypothetical protein
MAGPIGALCYRIEKGEVDGAREAAGEVRRFPALPNGSGLFEKSGSLSKTILVASIEARPPGSFCYSNSSKSQRNTYP